MYLPLGCFVSTGFLRHVAANQELVAGGGIGQDLNVAVAQVLPAMAVVVLTAQLAHGLVEAVLGEQGFERATRRREAWSSTRRNTPPAPSCRRV